jgi:hypothetical protein
MSPSSLSNSRISTPCSSTNTPALLNIYICQSATKTREGGIQLVPITPPLPEPRKFLDPETFSFPSDPSQPAPKWRTVRNSDLQLSCNATLFDIELFAPDSAPAKAKEVSMFGSKYKKVAKRTFPVSAATPEEFHIVRRSPPNILASMKPLPAIPPPFQPGVRYMEERKQTQNIDPAGFLSPSEADLVHWILRENKHALAWNELEKGSFSQEWFDLIKIPTVDHVPWVLKNIPLPPGIRDKVIEIIKSKIAAGTYEPSNSSYRSAWFCVLKKDDTSLQLVHNLQPLNAVTIRDAAVPPNMD